MTIGKTLLPLTLLVVSSLQAEEIRIAASDLLADFIAEPLVAFGLGNGMKIEIDSIGSLPAIDRLRADEIDLAIIAVPEAEEVPRGEFSAYPFAYDATVIAVNEGNPIDELSISQLSGVFGSQEEFNFNSWGDLRLSGWGTRSIKPLVGISEESISLELFKYSVLDKGEMKAGVTMVKDDEIADSIRTNLTSIGILSSVPKSAGVKVLMVSETQDSPAFSPSSDNIHYGDYPIRLAFYIIFNPRDEAKLQPLIRELFNDPVAVSLSENQLFALPETVRRKLLIDLDFESRTGAEPR